MIIVYIVMVVYSLILFVPVLFGLFEIYTYFRDNKTAKQ